MTVAAWLVLLGTLGLPGAGEGVESIGRLDHPPIREASGLVASRRYPGVFWVHNDSGDTARVFAMSTSGRHLAEVQLLGVEANDWEDMAIVAAPDGGPDRLVIADMGDSILATGVLLDNFRWECAGCIPSEVDSCGIQPQ